MGGGHPGARASRPHPLPWVAAQFPCDAAPGHPAGGNRMGPTKVVPGRRFRAIRLGEMGETVPGFMRAGRPRSRGLSFRPILQKAQQITRGETSVWHYRPETKKARQPKIDCLA